MVAGVGGFFGTNLLETLFKLAEKVMGLGNFATGHPCNMDDGLAVLRDTRSGINVTMPGCIRYWSEVNTESFATEIAYMSQI